MNRHTKIVLKHIAGWLCIALGVLMLITPGQGIITILIGIFLLADHIPLFAKIRLYLKRRYPKTFDFVQLKMELLHNKFAKKG